MNAEVVTVEGSYSPGERVVITAGNVWLLAQIDPAHEAVGRWWTNIREGASVAQVLDDVLEEGFRTVPSFAILDYDPEARAGTVVLRGDVRARLIVDNMVHDHLADTSAPWREIAIDGTVTRVDLVEADATESAVLLPLTSGVTVADAIRVVLRAPGAPTRADLRPSPVLPADQPAEESRVAPEAPEAPEPPTFDFLFGATQQRPPEAPVSWNADGAASSGEAAEVADAEMAPASVSASPEILSTTLQPSDTLYPAPADPGDVGRSSPGGLISALPWEVDDEWPGAEPPPSASTASGSDPVAASPHPAEIGVPVESLPTPNAEQATVNRSALLAAANAVPHLGPTVKAVECEAGHLSPPQLESCRVCGAPLSPQNAFTAPRPVLGAIRLSTGDVVTLDRNVVMGRAPQSHATDNAAERPHVVKLASPENDISRNHLEIRLEDWHVLVVDLDSVNGTVVTLPNREPQRLRPNDALAIEPGTLVTLADEVSFVYEVGV